MSRPLLQWTDARMAFRESQQPQQQQPQSLVPQLHHELEKAFAQLSLAASNTGDSGRVAEVAAAREAALHGRLPECWHCELSEEHPGDGACLRQVVQSGVWLQANTLEDMESARDEEESARVPWDFSPAPEEDEPMK